MAVEFSPVATGSYSRVWCAACHVCAYKPWERPFEPEPLPQGSAVGMHDPLATCKNCGGLFCSVHGTCYSMFECAVCKPGKAVYESLVPGGGPQHVAAAEHMRDLALMISPDGSRRARSVIERIQSEQEARPSAAERRQVAGEQPAPSLLDGLATVIRKSMSDSVEGFGSAEARQFRWVPKAHDAERSDSFDAGRFGISIDAIGATVAATFADAEIDPRPDADLIIHGAALVALAVADEGVAEQMSHFEPGGEIAVKPPWKATHPALLDPIMWMILTAYQDQ
jgi:hypothetical protein